jgi:F-type H+-transporting ATPase subunit gamma
MAQSRKLIKARIKSIRNTRKITKAMELVAASKMRKATAATLRSRPYTQEAWATIRSVLRSAPELRHPLLTANPKAKKTLIILFSSDRGLAGGFNVNMIRTTIQETKRLGIEQVDIVGVGKRGADALERSGVKIIARFPAMSNNPQFTDLLPVARMALEGFLTGEYRGVSLAYTDFISGITQKPRIQELLPLTPDLDEQSGSEYTFEPSPMTVLERVLPALAETMTWQALLESIASEHAARMMAMKNASDSAKDMLSALTFTYNQARQAGITQEIAEISSGKAALE